MIDYRNIIRNRELRLKLINLLRFIPDEPYLKMVFWIKTGKKLELKDPKTFCDKLNWLKLHNRRPEFTQMVDKVAVKDYLYGILGEDICLPMLGHWDHYDDINFDALPDRFVLKCNHDSGSTKVILDKSTMDHAELRKFFEGRLALNPFVLGREYPYRDVKPCICAEKYMVPDGESDINDFKFMCFNGKPEIMYIITDRSGGGRKDFFDMEYRHLDVTGVYPNADCPPPKPIGFDRMKELAALLCQGTDFVRVDFFEIGGKVYFGEFTFYDDGGFWPKDPPEWERKMGDMIHLEA